MRRRSGEAVFISKYIGDDVLVYFGYPEAHEDDAEQAVRAGLELIQAVGSWVPSPLCAAPQGSAFPQQRRAPACPKFGQLFLNPPLAIEDPDGNEHFLRGVAFGLVAAGADRILPPDLPAKCHCRRQEGWRNPEWD
jgi:hypothetical protein